MKTKDLLKRRFEINGGEYFVNAWFDRDNDFSLDIMDYEGEGLDNWEHYLKHKDNEIYAALFDLCLEAPGCGRHYKSGITIFVR
jgi:hypothetical protein